MSYWELLGIPPTDDINLIKKAYAEKSKLYHPETHPEQFQELHHAYKFLVAQCKRKKAYEEKLQAEEKTKQPELETLDIPPVQIAWGFSGSTKKPKEQPEAPEPAQAPVAENKTPSEPALAPNGASQTPVTERKTVQADADFLSLVEQDGRGHDRVRKTKSLPQRTGDPDDDDRGKPGEAKKIEGPQFVGWDPSFILLTRKQLQQFLNFHFS